MNEDRPTPAFTKWSTRTLVCWKCQKSAIPAPLGATANTRYICPSCSGEGIAGNINDLQFQNWQWNSRYARRGVNSYERDVAATYDLKHKAIEIRGNNPDDVRDDIKRIPARPQDEWRRLKRQAREAEPLGDSPRFSEAISNGEAWALALQSRPEALWKLPCKRGLALLWSIWGGLSGMEISRALGMTSRQGANVAIRRAKRQLAESVSTQAETITQVEEAVLEFEKVAA